MFLLLFLNLSGMRTCRAWSNFIQDKLDISICPGTSIKKVNAIPYFTLVFNLNLHAFWKTVWILTSWLMFSTLFISGFILFSKKVYICTASNLCLLLQKEQNVKGGEGPSGKQAVGINNGTR